ncbi:MAG TPA: hypothetical protein VGF13_11535 [Verrucomicrobiae bacterium]|jgi:hypothetical protein
MKHPATALKWLRMGLACGFFVLAVVALLGHSSGYVVAVFVWATVALAARSQAGGDAQTKVRAPRGNEVARARGHGHGDPLMELMTALYQ